MEFRISLGLIIVSDRAVSGVRPDQTIPTMQRWCREKGFNLIWNKIVPDNADQIADELKQAITAGGVDIILTSGGTGFSPNDVTPEATQRVIEKRTPGIDEYLRHKGTEKTPYAVLSRGISGISGNILIINLPGNPQAAIENMDWLEKILPHARALLKGTADDQSHSLQI